MSAIKENRQKNHKVKIVVTIAGVLALLILIAVIYILFFSKDNGSPGHPAGPPTSPGRLSPEAIEQRFDGKDPKGKDGPDSKCADPPSSQPVDQTQPQVVGPDGHPVGTVELRTSGICPVIWARVHWLNSSYILPAGWSLHISMHRPSPLPEKVTDYTALNASDYVYGNMLTTVRGCVYAEVYFSNGNSKTQATKTACRK